MYEIRSHKRKNAKKVNKRITERTPSRRINPIANAKGGYLAVHARRTKRNEAEGVKTSIESLKHMMISKKTRQKISIKSRLMTTNFSKGTSCAIVSIFGTT